jgi:hypothetical protein
MIDSATAQFVNNPYDFRIGFVPQHISHNRQGGFICVAAAQYLAGGQARIGNTPVDRFTTAVHHNGPQASRLQEHNVFQQGAYGLGGVHGAATQFDHYGLVAEPPEVA